MLNNYRSLLLSYNKIFNFNKCITDLILCKHMKKLCGCSKRKTQITYLTRPLYFLLSSINFPMKLTSPPSVMISTPLAVNAFEGLCLSILRDCNGNKSSADPKNGGLHIQKSYTVSFVSKASVITVFPVTCLTKIYFTFANYLKSNKKYQR